ncbi:MAG: hypothetical protein JNL74_09845 [Fibrobacteres bacterium]|nr:hypothetical protein [Fibrobacterota bacterium]
MLTYLFTIFIIIAVPAFGIDSNNKVLKMSLERQIDSIRSTYDQLSKHQQHYADLKADSLNQLIDAITLNILATRQEGIVTVTNNNTPLISTNPETVAELSKLISSNKRAATAGMVIFYTGIALKTYGIVYNFTSDVSNEPSSNNSSSSNIFSNPFFLSSDLCLIAGPLLTYAASTNLRADLVRLKIKDPTNNLAWDSYKQGWMFEGIGLGCFLIGVILGDATNTNIIPFVGAVTFIGFDIAALYQFGKSAHRAGSYIKSIETEQQGNRLHFTLSPQIDVNGKAGLKATLNY